MFLAASCAWSSVWICKLTPQGPGHRSAAGWLPPNLCPDSAGQAPSASWGQRLRRHAAGRDGARVERDVWPRLGRAALGGSRWSAQAGRAGVCTKLCVGNEPRIRTSQVRQQTGAANPVRNASRGPRTKVRGGPGGVDRPPGAIRHSAHLKLGSYHCYCMH